MKNSLQPYYYAAYSGMGWQKKKSRNDVDGSSGHTMRIACVRQGWKFDDDQYPIRSTERSLLTSGLHQMDLQMAIISENSGNSEWT